LRKSLGGIINAATGTSVSIDTSKVGLIAHSLGGMVAIPYLAVEPTSTPSSTENLADIMGASNVSSTMSIAVGNPGIVNFTVGSHSSPLAPDAATVGIQTQLANFQGYSLSPLGPTIVIDSSNCSIIEDAVCTTTAQ